MSLNDAVHDAMTTMTEGYIMEQEKEKLSVQKYVDESMFTAAPMTSVTPKVHLLWMTPDPLGAIAAACRMYEGKPTYDLAEITDRERIDYLRQVQATHLKAPLEFVKLHFFIEGVDRAFTHQIVRQRTAVFAQESLRFAVKENLAKETPYPPSFFDGSQSRQNDFADIWNKCVKDIENAYNTLVANGIPAEDARGLLPHAVTTRLHYCTDLRNLSDHSGNRLCTQAQFHWRTVFQQIVEKIANGAPTAADHWQFEALAESGLFAPVCYQMNKCPFKADFDRGCTIRPRVDAFADMGVPSQSWDREHFSVKLNKVIGSIDRAEWADDPKAAWQ